MSQPSWSPLPWPLSLFLPSRPWPGSDHGAGSALLLSLPALDSSRCASLLFPSDLIMSSDFYYRIDSGPLIFPLTTFLSFLRWLWLAPELIAFFSFFCFKRLWELAFTSRHFLGTFLFCFDDRFSCWISCGETQETSVLSLNPFCLTLLIFLTSQWLLSIRSLKLALCFSN